MQKQKKMSGAATMNNKSDYIVKKLCVTTEFYLVLF